jgi:hypothetical protein
MQTDFSLPMLRRRGPRSMVVHAVSPKLLRVLRRVMTGSRSGNGRERPTTSSTVVETRALQAVRRDKNSAMTAVTFRAAFIAPVQESPNGVTARAHS